MPLPLKSLSLSVIFIQLYSILNCKPENINHGNDFGETLARFWDPPNPPGKITASYGPWQVNKKADYL